jgi:hypothetical protein
MVECCICGKKIKKEDAGQCPANEGFYFCDDCLDKNNGNCPICA